MSFDPDASAARAVRGNVAALADKSTLNHFEYVTGSDSRYHKAMASTIRLPDESSFAKVHEKLRAFAALPADTIPA